MLSLVIIIVSGFLGAYCLTWLVRQYALSRNVLDVPNERSSHTQPTPRGGGVAFVLAFVIGGCIMVSAGLWAVSSAVAVLGSGLIVAATGFVDDHRHIAARWRLGAHFAASAWALYWVGGAPLLSLFGVDFGISGVATILAAIFLVWMLNLYNFMDGIDGIASVEAVSVCVGGALLYVILGYAEMSVAPLLLAATVCGFLVWNFPPARIFMGDAGSGFLGMALGVMAIQAGWVNQGLFWAWLIMLGVFIVDATYTLSRRLIRRERVYEAHRSHAYQHASQHFGGHLPVTAAVCFINVLWLWPLAFLAATERVDGLLALFIAYVPLTALATAFKAGNSERQLAG